MDDLRFEGKTGKEAEDFVTAVRKIALNQGKHRDLEWTAAFASTCFYGTALRWFEDLDDEVQSDWKLLRKAILQQWPAETRSGGSFLPTSAAAPPPPIGRTATVPSAAVKSLSLFKCIYCKLQYRPVDEEFCSAQCQDSASRAAPLLIELEPTDPLYKEVNTLFSIDWKQPRKTCPSVKHIFKVVMRPTLMEYYYAYRRAVEERGSYVSKGLKPGNEQRVWTGVARACDIGDDGASALPCSTAGCELCKIIKDSFELPKVVVRFLRFGVAIRGTTVSSKADDYSTSRTGQKALILSSVVMGEVFFSQISLKSMPTGFQSISFEPGQEFNWNDTVVHNEDAMRPEYIVIY